MERAGKYMSTRAAGDSTTTNWAGLTVPQYLTDMYAPATPRCGRSPISATTTTCLLTA